MKVLMFVAVVCCCGLLVAQEPTPAQPQAQPQVQVQVQVGQPNTQFVVPTQVTGAAPVWVIRKKAFFPGYRAKPGWVNTGLFGVSVAIPAPIVMVPQVVAPMVMVPQVIVPPPVVIPPPVVLPQPVITYQPQIRWQ